METYEDDSSISLLSSADWATLEDFDERSNSSSSGSTIRPYQVLATKSGAHSPPICSIKVSESQDGPCVFQVSFERAPDNVVELRGPEIIDFCTALLEYHTCVFDVDNDYTTGSLGKQYVKPQDILSSLDWLLECANSVTGSSDESALPAPPPTHHQRKPWQNKWKFEENNDHQEMERLDDDYLDDMSLWAILGLER